MSKVAIEIVTCGQWGARKPKQGIQMVGKSKRGIFHHTAGHHHEISLPKDESFEEACRYARDIQAFHMAPGGLGARDGGIDSGHNFLVCRNGMILQGRWLTVSAIEAGHMVASAHCPGQNDQIGIEHEHKGTEAMTMPQKISSARLMAWISWQYEMKTILSYEPHRKYYNTSCPANLVSDIPRIRQIAADILSGKL